MFLTNWVVSLNDDDNAAKDAESNPVTVLAVSATNAYDAEFTVPTTLSP